MSEVTIYIRIKTNEIYGSQQVKAKRQKAEYLCDIGGLKLCGYYVHNGDYHISEACSGSSVLAEIDRDSALYELEILKSNKKFTESVVKNAKSMAKYYGINALQHDSMYVFKSNTLASRKCSNRNIKRYASRSGEDVKALFRSLGK